MKIEDIKNTRTIRHIYYFFNGILKKGKYKVKAAEALKRFEVEFDDRKKNSVINDMVREKTFNGIEFSEYLCYRFYDRNKKERRSIVADWEHLGYACIMNNHKNDELFDNKWKTFNKFKKYYKREVVLFEGQDDVARFKNFMEDKESFVVKLLDASCGRGVQIVEKSDFDGDVNIEEMLIKEYSGRFIAEELVVQHSEMAKFHPASLNTVRIPTIRLDDETLVVNPFMRLGRNGKNVDNAGAGGIICAVDVETGKIIAAADRDGKSYTKHPESGEQIVGFEIPLWNEAKKLVRELAEVVPDNRYTGWDMALTDEGWKLIEANRRGQFVWQIPTQVGFREEINTILKRMGRKY